MTASVENPMVRPIKEESSHWGIDACGDEILHGDAFYEFPDGEVVLKGKIAE